MWRYCLCAQGSLQPILSQLTCQSREGCAMGALWLEGLQLGRGFTIPELFFYPSTGLDKSGSLSLHQISYSAEGCLGKCLWVKLLALGTKISRAGVGKGLCQLCQQIYLSLVHVKSCRSETKVLWFLGSPKSKGWISSYFFINFFLCLPSLALFAVAFLIYQVLAPI